MKWLSLIWALWDVIRNPALPEPDTKGAKGRRYDSPEQGYAPPDAPHIPEDGKL